MLWTIWFHGRLVKVLMRKKWLGIRFASKARPVQDTFEKYLIRYSIYLVFRYRYLKRSECLLLTFKNFPWQWHVWDFLVDFQRLCYSPFNYNHWCTSFCLSSNFFWNINKRCCCLLLLQWCIMMYQHIILNRWFRFKNDGKKLIYYALFCKEWKVVMIDNVTLVISCH